MRAESRGGEPMHSAAPPSDHLRAAPVRSAGLYRGTRTGPHTKNLDENVLKVLALGQPCQGGDFVRRERELAEVVQPLEAFDLVDFVSRQVELLRAGADAHGRERVTGAWERVSEVHLRRARPAGTASQRCQRPLP